MHNIKLKQGLQTLNVGTVLFPKDYKWKGPNTENYIIIRLKIYTYTFRLVMLRWLNSKVWYGQETQNTWWIKTVSEKTTRWQSFTQVDNITKCVFNKGSEDKAILNAQIIYRHMIE